MPFGFTRAVTGVGSVRDFCAGWAEGFAAPLEAPVAFALGRDGEPTREAAYGIRASTARRWRIRSSSKITVCCI